MRRDELELGAAVDRERREVARVDADHRRAERDRAVELVGVVRLDERVEPERAASPISCAHVRVVEVAQQEQRRVGAGAARGLEVLAVEKKPFASSGASVAARAARRSSQEPPKRSSTSTEIAAAPAPRVRGRDRRGSASGGARPPRASAA